MKNIKYIRIIPIFILSMISPSFSDTLSNNSQCDNATLHTTTGPATLNARWTANTIILNWNAGNDATFTAPTQNDAAYSCEYDGGITLPTAPTRSGYTFGGWAVRAQSCLAQHYPAGNSTGSGYINDRTHASSPNSENANQYNLTEDNTWAVAFSEGVLKGRAICTNVTSSTWETIMTGVENGTLSLEEARSMMPMLWGANGDGIASYNTFSSNSTGQNCWCAGTDFGNSCHIASPSWVFMNRYSSSDDCANYCAGGCAESSGIVSPFGAAVFGVTQ